MSAVRPRTEEAFDERVQIDRRRLIVPVLGERRSAGVIGADRRSIHSSPRPSDGRAQRLYHVAVTTSLETLRGRVVRFARRRDHDAVAPGRAWPHRPPCRRAASACRARSRRHPSRRCRGSPWPSPPCPQRSIVVISNWWRMRSATRCACSVVVCGNRQQNSSPPIRNRKSVGRMQAFTRSTKPVSTSSPPEWPKRSLSDLKWSRSRNSRQSGARCWRGAATAARRAP